MRITGSSTLRLPDFRTALSVRAADRPVAAEPDRRPLALRDLARELHRLRDQLGDVRRAGRIVNVGASLSIASRSSANALGLEAATFTTRNSAAEVNTIATSYTPFAPSWTGSSNAVIDLNGTYDGDQGNNTLRLQARDTGVVGVNNIRVRVYNGAGNQIEQVTFNASNLTRTLSNGIQVTLQAGGSVVANDQFFVGVSTTTGMAVNPQNAFNGTGNARANLEPGKTVTNGTFSINGASIAVLASDSINSVLAKINASAAGVNATFNSSTERIELTQLTAGSQAHITFGADTSGFLVATKLSTSTEVTGTDSDFDRPIAQVPELAGIGNGTFLVNGTTFNVNRATDTLSGLLSQINAAGVGVTAGYDPASDRVTFTATSAGAPLTLDDGTSNFFTALQVTVGSTAGQGAPKTRLRAPRRIDDELEELGRQLEATLTKAAGQDLDGVGGAARERLFAALRGTFGVDDDVSRFRAYGIEIDLGSGSDQVLGIDRNGLRKATRDQTTQLGKFLTETVQASGKRGFLAGIDLAIEDTLRQIEGQLGSDDRLGLLLDRLG